MKALLLVIFSIALLFSGPAFAESLVDIKVDELSKPVKSKWGKDPFVRQEDREGQGGEDLGPIDLRVEGIISDNGKALAIINGGFYRKGDEIRGFAITEILADRVILRKGGKDYVLQIKSFTGNSPGEETGK